MPEHPLRDAPKRPVKQDRDRDAGALAIGLVGHDYKLLNGHAEWPFRISAG